MDVRRQDVATGSIATNEADDPQASLRDLAEKDVEQNRFGTKKLVEGLTKSTLRARGSLMNLFNAAQASGLIPKTPTSKGPSRMSEDLELSSRALSPQCGKRQERIPASLTTPTKTSSPRLRHSRSRPHSRMAEDCDTNVEASPSGCSGATGSFRNRWFSSIGRSRSRPRASANYQGYEADEPEVPVLEFSKSALAPRVSLELYASSLMGGVDGVFKDEEASQPRPVALPVVSATSTPADEALFGAPSPLSAQANERCKRDGEIFVIGSVMNEPSPLANIAARDQSIQDLQVTGDHVASTPTPANRAAPDLGLYESNYQAASLVPPGAGSLSRSITDNNAFAALLERTGNVSARKRKSSFSEDSGIDTTLLGVAEAIIIKPVEPDEVKLVDLNPQSNRSSGVDDNLMFALSPEPTESQTKSAISSPQNMQRWATEQDSPIRTPSIGCRKAFESARAERARRYDQIHAAEESNPIYVMGDGATVTSDPKEQLSNLLRSLALLQTDEIEFPVDAVNSLDLDRLLNTIEFLACKLLLLRFAKQKPELPQKESLEEEPPAVEANDVDSDYSSMDEEILQEHKERLVKTIFDLTLDSKGNGVSMKTLSKVLAKGKDATLRTEETLESMFMPYLGYLDVSEITTEEDSDADNPVFALDKETAEEAGVSPDASPCQSLADKVVSVFPGQIRSCRTSPCRSTIFNDINKAQQGHDKTRSPSLSISTEELEVTVPEAAPSEPTKPDHDDGTTVYPEVILNLRDICEMEKLAKGIPEAPGTCECD